RSRAHDPPDRSHECRRAANRMSGARLRRGFIALLFVVAVAAPGATYGRQAPADDRITISQYIAQLDSLDAAISRASSDAERAAVVAKSLPPVWRVQAANRLFEISSASLARD